MWCSAKTGKRFAQVVVPLRADMTVGNQIQMDSFCASVRLFGVLTVPDAPEKLSHLWCARGIIAVVCTEESMYTDLCVFKPSG